MMNCEICNIYADDVSLKYSNCFIECLEKIKLHYMDMLKKLGDNKLVIKTLQENNSKLQAKLGCYERTNGEKALFKLDYDQSESYSDVFENGILNKTVDSLNVALNEEGDFETSYVSDSPNNIKKQKLKREPMKSINCGDDNIKVTSNALGGLKQEFIKCKEERIPLKENRSCFSRKNSRKNDRCSQDRPRLSLKSSHLRQRRLPVDLMKKSLNDDNIFDLSISPEEKTITKGNSIIQRNESETPSVMLLTPETQDIIFLDDTCDSNIESMDLLRDFVSSSDERLKKLKIFESNRIKLLQKTASTKTMNDDNDFEISNKKDSTNFILENLEETNVNDASNELEETNCHASMKKTVLSKDHRLIRVNCDECEKYIKYLGARLSDEEIEKHLRNCTKHKNVEISSTPEGFWDPKIRPLDKDDPRNKILVDTRFLRK